MDSKEYKEIIVPKSVIWSALAGFVGLLLTTWIAFEFRFATIEKEIAVIKITVEIQNKTNEINSQRFEKIQEQLYEIGKILTVKQDKRFIE